MEFEKFVSEAMKTSTIKVTSYDDKIICGFIENPNLEAALPFRGCPWLISILDTLQDALDFPQKTFKLRSFADTPSPTLEALEKVEQKPGQKIIASFRVSIFYRQNASWQGRIVWDDQARSSSFRSTMELIMLMDSALSCGAAENDKG